MKRILTFALAAAMAMPALFSQDRDSGWRDRIRSERIAFITEELSLTSKEAEKFWPVYNTFRDRKAEAQKAIRDAYRALDEAVREGNATDKCISDYVEALDAKAGIETQALKEYRKVLPAEKIARLYIAEEKFRMQQIHRLHHDPDRDAHRRPAPEKPKCR